jgi:hypothetical protein
MGMWTTENQDTLADVLRSFGKAGREVYGDYAFEAGYLNSLAIEMLKYLPKRQQKEIINDLIRGTQKLEQRVIDRMNETVA